jgi:hypothetical protein
MFDPEKPHPIAALIAGGELMADDLDDSRFNHEITRVQVEEMKTWLRDAAKQTDQHNWEVGLSVLQNAIYDLEDAADEADEWDAEVGNVGGLVQ